MTQRKASAPTIEPEAVHVALDRVKDGTASQDDWYTAMPYVESILGQLGVQALLSEVHRAFREDFEMNTCGDEDGHEAALRIAIEQFTGYPFCRRCLSFHPRGGAHHSPWTKPEFNPARKAFYIFRDLRKHNASSN